MGKTRSSFKVIKTGGIFDSVVADLQLRKYTTKIKEIFLNFKKLPCDKELFEILQFLKRFSQPIESNRISDKPLIFLC